MKLIATLVLLAVPALAAGDAAAGKTLFESKCKACHGVDGAGTPAMLKKYGEKLKPLGGPAVQGMKDAELTKAVKEGATHKALVKSLTDADYANLAAHIRNLKK